MALFMELEDYISGERFQNIADISIIPHGLNNGEKKCGFVVEQQNNNNYRAFYYDTNTTSLPSEVDNVNVIFVNTWTLDKFFKIVFPLLTNKYIFISHNSDLGINKQHQQYLDSSKVIRWYSQNAYLKHDKLFALPIGLGNQQYSHGNIKLLDEIKNTNYQKEFLVYKNFDISSNPHKRSLIDSITTSNKIFMSKNTNIKPYFETIAKSAFCICPPGNGNDCHRIWECLYLKTIPIIEKNSWFEQFEHLPILLTEDWNDIKIETLRDKFLQMQHLNFNIEELKLNYWKTHICKV
jgi:hypothetical protein